MRIFVWLTLGLLCAACGEDGDPSGPGGGVATAATTGSGGGGNGGGTGGGGTGGAGAGGDATGGASGVGELAEPDAIFLHPTAARGAAWNLAVTGAPDGGAYVSGAAQGEIALGRQTIAEGGIFLIRLDREGGLLWTAPIDTARLSLAPAVTVDRSGNVLFAGEVYGDATIGSTTLPGATDAEDPADAVVAKLDDKGVVLWARRFASPAGDRCFAIATDATGHVYVGGHVGDDIDFGDGLVAVDNTSPFLLKLTPDGEVAWAKVFNRTDIGYSAVNGIAVHEGGDVSVTGSFYPPMTIDGMTLPAPEHSDMGFVARFSSAGEARFARSFGGSGSASGSASGRAIAVGEGTFLAGTVSGEVEVDVLGTTVDAGSTRTPFVAKLMESGTAEWVITPAPSGMIHGLAPDRAGGVYAAGVYDDDVTSDYMPFALHARASSEITALQRYASEHGNADSVALNSDGTLWVAGSFAPFIDIGSGPVESLGLSGFVLRFPPP
ncbi:hypothetical protein [Sorangium sp. So ce1099]|uniref:hypothetical protein n=1 Tax=Sorangium sp. So ce1099 TaxID=3133331 RepID=UPI003F62D533